VLNRVGIPDAADAVAQVLQEQEENIDPGTIDLIWINGENFARLKEADMLYAGWARDMPNSKYVDWDNPALNHDFGEPIEELESPWSSAQLQLIYDTARIDEDDLPRSYEEMQEWACDNPGHFTYIAPGPGAFQGTRFVKGALYEISGEVREWRSFDEELWDEWSPELWDYWNDIKPCLWEEGVRYPADEMELLELFKDEEVDFALTQIIAGTGPLIVDGLVPSTARPFVFDDHMIGDYNYVAIPRNAPHKAAALVLANLLLEPQFQAAQILPDSGFGLGFGIDVSLVPEQEAEVLQQAQMQLGEFALSSEELQDALAPDTAPIYQELIEEGWQEYVLEAEESASDDDE
jgi:putative spermidine/putrescine transport system substrate-binding protein